MRETGLAKGTVRRFYRAGSAGELLAKITDGRPSVLDEHKPYLHQRWNEGCTNVRQLHVELRDRGYRGSYGTVRGYVQPFREPGAAPPAVPAPPKARDVASWILRDPDTLDDDEKAKLAQVRERCPHLAALAGHVTEFAKILTGRHGDRLDDWIAAVEADDQPDLHSFARGLKHDYDAVRNGLTLPWSSGVVEGTVNIKDQDDQTPDVRARRLPAAPQASPPGNIRRARYHHEIRVRSRSISECYSHAHCRCLPWCDSGRRILTPFAPRCQPAFQALARRAIGS
jgi:hypothetical protein